MFEISNLIVMLADALRSSCTLYSQLIAENTRLCELELHDQPTGPCIRRVDGKAQILAADEAAKFDEANINEQTRHIRRVEYECLAAIQETKELIAHADLADAIEPFVDESREWLSELLDETERMNLARVKVDILTPEDRMAALVAVIKRLNHLQCIQEIGGRPTVAR